MTFFFDLTPFIVFAAVLGLAVVWAISYVAYSLFKYRVYVPLKHWKTGLKLYRFEKQILNDRIVEEHWFGTDDQAKEFASCRNFYSFCTKEIYPRFCYLKDREGIK